MSSNQLQDPRLSGVPPPAPALASQQFGTQFLPGSQSLGQATFNSMSAIPQGTQPLGPLSPAASSQLQPVAFAPPPTMPMMMPPTTGGFSQQLPSASQASMSGFPLASSLAPPPPPSQALGSTMPGSFMPLDATMPQGSMPGLPMPEGPRSVTPLPADRIESVTHQSAMPYMFTTPSVPQILREDSGYSRPATPLGSRDVVTAPSADNSPMQETQSGKLSDDVSSLKTRLQGLQRAKANADQENGALKAELSQLKDSQSLSQDTQTESQERIAYLEKMLANSKAYEAMHEQKHEELSAMLEDKEAHLSRSLSQEAQHEDTHKANDHLRWHLEEQLDAARSEKEEHKAKADEHAESLEAMAKQLDDLKNKLDESKKKQSEDGRNIAHLQKKLEGESKEKEHHKHEKEEQRAHIDHIEGELAHTKACETFHKNQSDHHRKHANTLKRFIDKDAPPSATPPRFPLKALEERVMHLGCFMMFGLCALPIIGAMACLSDRNYMFWLGNKWPLIIIAGCVVVFIAFGVAMQVLHSYAQPEYRSKFTMAFTWATFAALLGVLLVPVGLFANQNAAAVASTVSQGCLSSLPESELLVDYSQVLYNIRLSANCTDEKSVKNCKGYASNEYTSYLEYLEQDFNCGPLCPESPPPARAVRAPGLWNTPVPTIKPREKQPPFFGPPLQGHLGGHFLQTSGGRDKRRQHAQAVSTALQPAGEGVMETSLPHMQAEKLFMKGKTSMTCYPLIATRLQVLQSTFGGLWYWEGMGLIMISFLTALYASMFLIFGGQ